MTALAIHDATDSRRGELRGLTSLRGPAAPSRLLRLAGGRPRPRNKVTRPRAKPTRGGDGGILGLVELEDCRGNRRVVLVCVAPSAPGLVETADPADRAHGVRVWDKELGWLLLSAATERGRPMPGLSAKARRYPRSQMTSRGVAFDSAFDEFARRLRELAGITLDAGNMADARWRSEPQLRSGALGKGFVGLGGRFGWVTHDPAEASGAGGLVRWS